MTELLTFCILSCFFCTGMFVAFNGPGMILNSVSDNLDLFCPEWLRKPLYECLSCMASIWSVVLWIAIYQSLSFKLIVAIVITCGMNTVVAYPVKLLLKIYEEEKWTGDRY